MVVTAMSAGKGSEVLSLYFSPSDFARPKRQKSSHIHHHNVSWLLICFMETEMMFPAPENDIKLILHCDRGFGAYLLRW